jgi:4-amino-4-deoxy-L-arabinose transferase-like glycosyltransferase
LEERNLLALGIILVLGFLVFFLGLGSAPLLDPDEARFARTSVEMMRSHDFVVPTFEGAPRLVKPPLLHWIQASLFRIFGPNELVARLPAACSAFVSLLLVAWIGWRRFGDEGAAWASTFFATFPLVVLTGRVGTLDALLAVHVLAVLALDLTQPDRTGLQKSAVVGGLLGLGFLVKGPVGVVLPLVMILAGRTACGRDVLPSARTIVTAVLAWSAVVLPWGLVFLQRVGQGSAVGTLKTEALSRYFEGTAHVEPWWFYGKIVLVAFLPWAVPLVAGTVRGLSRLRESESPTGPYAAAALTAGLVFFSLGKGKLPNYLVPLAPLAALVIAFELGQELVSPAKRRIAPALLAATLVAVALVLGVAGALRLEGTARVAVLGGAVVYGVGALVAMWGILESSPRWVYGAAAGAALLFLMIVVIAAPPLVGAARSAKPLVDAVPQLASARPLVLVDRQLPSLTYYVDRVPERVDGRGLGERLDRGDGPLVVITDSDFEKLPTEVRRRLRRLGGVGNLSAYEANSPAP